MLRDALKSFLANPIQDCYRAAKAAKARFRNIEVPDDPKFDDEGLKYFYARIATCKCYLEYGSGGSTSVIARQGIRFTSVESDCRFLAAVRAKVEKSNVCVDGTFLHGNIGMVDEWGYPALKDLTPRRKARWKSYPLTPWPAKQLPDLILIDGRFRVASALVTIKNLYGKIDFEILFDDYGDRDYYRPVERFARLDSMHGRMAIFKEKTISLSDLDAAIEQFSTDYR